MKPVKYGPFLGVNNRLPDSGLRVDLPQLNGQYLRSAVNVDIDNRRHLVRRKGMTLVQAMTNPHSVFRATTGYSYVVRSGVLYSINLETYSETLIKALSTNDKLTYVEVNGSVFASNGTKGVWQSKLGAGFTGYPSMEITRI